jgi:hypothetical protein
MGSFSSVRRTTDRSLWLLLYLAVLYVLHQSNIAMFQTIKLKLQLIISLHPELFPTSLINHLSHSTQSTCQQCQRLISYYLSRKCRMGHVGDMSDDATLSQILRSIPQIPRHCDWILERVRCQCMSKINFLHFLPGFWEQFILPVSIHISNQYPASLYHPPSNISIRWW